MYSYIALWTQFTISFKSDRTRVSESSDGNSWYTNMVVQIQVLEADFVKRLFLWLPTILEAGNSMYIWPVFSFNLLFSLCATFRGFLLTSPVSLTDSYPPARLYGCSLLNQSETADSRTATYISLSDRYTRWITNRAVLSVFTNGQEE